MIIAYYLAAIFAGWIIAELPAYISGKAVPAAFNLAGAFIAVCVLHAILS